jgi:hypothetical protein
MQLVSAFSRPQTFPPVAKSVPQRNHGIPSSWGDLIFFVATPAVAKQFNETLRLHPDAADAAENLGFALAGGRAGDSKPR